MASIVSTAFISLDGVAEDAGGGEYRNAGWSFKDVEFVEAAYELKGTEQPESTVLLMGTNTYKLFSPIWPTMDDFAHYNSLPKYVVSNSLTDDDVVDNWGPTTILRSLDEVAALKESNDGQIIVHGSIDLNHSLSDAGLIDRYNLLVFPLLLGEGKRLFSDTSKDTQKLELVDSESYSNGVQKNVFDVVR